MQCSVFLQLNITGHCHGPSVEETKDLWVQADIDGNGVVDHKEFQVALMELCLRYLLALMCKKHCGASLILVIKVEGFSIMPYASGPGYLIFRVCSINQSGCLYECLRDSNHILNSESSA